MWVRGRMMIWVRGRMVMVIWVGVWVWIRLYNGFLPSPPHTSFNHPSYLLAVDTPARTPDVRSKDLEDVTVHPTPKQHHSRMGRMVRVMMVRVRVRMMIWVRV